jgi:hypothetical protein
MHLALHLCRTAVPGLLSGPPAFLYPSRRYLTEIQQSITKMKKFKRRETSAHLCWYCIPGFIIPSSFNYNLLQRRERQTIARGSDAEGIDQSKVEKWLREINKEVRWLLRCEGQTIPFLAKGRDNDSSLGCLHNARWNKDENNLMLILKTR